MEFEDKSASQVLKWAIHSFAERFAIVTSFQDEGMALIDLAAGLDAQVRVVTVDTGRLPAETHAMIETVRSRYGIGVEVVTPEAEEVAAMVERHGPNLFRREVPLRMLCCQIRKVRPLENKLRDFDAWAVGLRREQSEERKFIAKAEQVNQGWKLSPLADWSAVELSDYLERNQVPRHPLYARGYRSIGCDPCTRATEAGEESRAGRWWWEEQAVKECGIHFSPTGEPRRQVDVLLSEVLAS
jgi:phosphoadenosine phosphosulfate reductase